jgi:hypothetical protein
VIVKHRSLTGQVAPVAANTRRASAAPQDHQAMQPSGLTGRVAPAAANTRSSSIGTAGMRRSQSKSSMASSRSQSSSYEDEEQCTGLVAEISAKSRSTSIAYYGSNYKYE